MYAYMFFMNIYAYISVYMYVCVHMYAGGCECVDECVYHSAMQIVEGMKPRQINQ